MGGVEDGSLLTWQGEGIAGRVKGFWGEGIIAFLLLKFLIEL